MHDQPKYKFDPLQLLTIVLVLASALVTYGTRTGSQDADHNALAQDEKRINKLESNQIRITTILDQQNQILQDHEDRVRSLEQSARVKPSAARQRFTVPDLTVIAPSAPAETARK